MIIDRIFHNFKCDCCGKLLDDETWWDGPIKPSILEECGWIECEDRHYCECCWAHDDDDNICTSDGRKWTDLYHKEIRQHRMKYLDLREDMTLTQFRMEYERGNALFKTMVGTLYKDMLADDLAEGKIWLDELIVARNGTEEYECYRTFLRHNIFRMTYNDAFVR